MLTLVVGRLAADCTCKKPRSQESGTLMRFSKVLASPAVTRTASWPTLMRVGR